jgi:chromate transport protein ChrA
VLAVATRLGLTSFGGPVAHLGYFREEYVNRRKWVDEATYADLVALCQFLPGPASSQVGIGLGIIRAGLLGGVMAWIGFTMPSVIALVLFGLGVQNLNLADAGWLHGLKIVAVAVVAQAVWGMARSLCPDRERATIAVVAAIAVLAFPTALGQVLTIAVAGLAGAALVLIAIFLPSFFLVVGALPFWDTVRAHPSFQAALRGVNAAVVGLLGAALYSPVWTSAILGPADVALGLAAFGLLMFWKAPPWLVVVLSAAGGAALARFA